VFKTLPIVIPQPGRTVGEAPTSSSPPKQCVLTNIEATQILNIDKGYPLPRDGGDWKWIGGWRIEKTGGLDTDEKGWSYSNDFDIMARSSYYSELRVPKKGSKNMVKRRRKWTRSRVMIDYPYASPMTKQYLKLVAEKAGLDVSVEKLSGQLVETKMNLTTLEADHLSLQERASRQILKLEKELEEKNKIVEFVDEAGLMVASSNSNSNKKDQVKELRSVVTQWVSNTVQKRQSVTDVHDGNTISSTEDGSDDDENSPAANIAKQQMFESLRGKGSDFLEKIKMKGGEELEKIKQNGGVKALPWQRKDKNGKATSSSSDNTPSAKTEPKWDWDP
jgi:hypothetical protein